MQNGQASTELIIILAAVFIIVIVFLVFSSGSLLNIGLSQNYSQAQTSVQALAAAADSVYAQGVGATQTVAVVIPGNTNFNANYTYVGRPDRAPSAPPNSININVGGTDVLATTTAPLTGSFPDAPGAYQMQVASQGAYVSIGTHLIDVSPPSVYVQMAPNGRAASVLSFNVAPGQSPSNGSVRVSIMPPPSISDVSVNASPSFFSAYEYTDAPVALTFSAAANASGIYNSQLDVNASGTSSDETFVIPITVEVQ